jgi:hypothetical protein
LATVLALLKTQGVMKELAWASSTPRAAREMAGSFMRGFGYMQRGERLTVATVSKSSDFLGVKRLRGLIPGPGNKKSDTERSHLPSGRIHANAPRLRTGETKRMTSTSKSGRTIIADNSGQTKKKVPTGKE